MALQEREKPPASEPKIRDSVKQRASSEWIILNVYTCTHHFLLSDKHILSAWSLWRVPKDLSILSEGSSFTERIWKTMSLLYWAEDSRQGIVLTRVYEATSYCSTGSFSSALVTLWGSRSEWPNVCVCAWACLWACVWIYICMHTLYKLVSLWKTKIKIKDVKIFFDVLCMH